VLRVRRLPGQGLEYEITKVLEDDGSVLPASTVAVHDAGVPERFFMEVSGIFFLGVFLCYVNERRWRLMKWTDWIVLGVSSPFYHYLREYSRLRRYAEHRYCSFRD